MSPKCRFCHEPLTHQWLDLGHAPPSNAYMTEAMLSQSEVYYPLSLRVCSSCLLVQTTETVSGEDIFDENYAYFSSYSSTWLAHASHYVERMIRKREMTEESFVVEVASNDGYLLQYFKKANIPCLGVEPSQSVALAAEEKGVPTLVDFFGEKTARALVSQRGKADLMVANNVLAHVPDINDFVRGFKILLAENGIITFEFPHLLTLIKGRQFDTVYHEHYFYFSAHVVRRIMAAHDLCLYDVESLPTHGGSLRAYVRHKSHDGDVFTKRLREVLDQEVAAGITRLVYYDGFQNIVERLKNNLLRFLLNCRKDKLKVAAYGAAAKGNTLLNFAGVRRDLIQFVVDASPHKVGKFLPGSHIPIVDEAHLKREKPDVILILPWNLKEEIAKQIGYAGLWGARLMVVLPKLEEIEPK